jgi:hypothetical protein
MSRWVPCKRRDFIQRLRKLGFDRVLHASASDDDTGSGGDNWS